MTELDRAPFGMNQLEITLGLAITNLVVPGHLDFPALIAKLATNPARALKLSKGTLAIGADADITIIDPESQWQVKPQEFASLSTNTPFEGLTLTGRASTVLVSGEIKLQR